MLKEKMIKIQSEHFDHNIIIAKKELSIIVTFKLEPAVQLERTEVSFQCLKKEIAF